MTIEEAEEYLQTWSQGNGDTPNAAAEQEAKETIIDAIRGGAHVANFYGMTVDAERRVMKNALRLIREVVDDYVFGCDSGSEDWRDYFTGYSDELDRRVEAAEWPSNFCYQLPSDEWLFKTLISWGTTRGGMGSAIEECRKIGKILKEDEDGDWDE